MCNASFEDGESGEESSRISFESYESSTARAGNEFIERLHQIAALRVAVVIDIEINQEGLVIAQIHQHIQNELQKIGVLRVSLENPEHDAFEEHLQLELELDSHGGCEEREDSNDLRKDVCRHTGTESQHQKMLEELVGYDQKEGRRRSDHASAGLQRHPHEIEAQKQRVVRFVFGNSHTARLQFRDFCASDVGVNSRRKEGDNAESSSVPVGDRVL